MLNVLPFTLYKAIIKPSNNNKNYDKIERTQISIYYIYIRIVGMFTLMCISVNNRTNNMFYF